MVVVGIPSLWRILCVVVATTPLLVGGVHRDVELGIGLAILLCYVTTVFHLLRDGRRPRWTIPALVPLFFVLVTISQLVPVPIALRTFLDPNGSALLWHSPEWPLTTFPMTLDIPATGLESLRAAVTLLVFLTALNLARSSRVDIRFLSKSVAISGGLVVAAMMWHASTETDLVFGHFGSISRSLRGTFVNPNHAADFLVLAAAAAFSLTVEAERRVAIWWTAAGLALCIASIATLSRTAPIGLLAGLVLYFTIHRAQLGSRFLRGKSLVTLGCAVMFLFAAIAANEALVDEWQMTDLSTDAKVSTWKSSLTVLRHHPLGIGRGAFGVVSPIYHEGIYRERHDFIESAPLQVLVDTGWIGFVSLALATGLALRHLYRNLSGDGFETIVLAGLGASAIHNMADFSGELFGVRIPFAALAGAVVGKTLPITGIRNSVSRRWILSFAPAAIVITSIGLRFHPMLEDFDEHLRIAKSQADKLAVAKAAAVAHPIDYFYHLSYALASPLFDQNTRTSPRLSRLNHALPLCPGCMDVRYLIADSLWSLGKTSQAMLAWRDAIDLSASSAVDLIARMEESGVERDRICLLNPQNPISAQTLAHWAVDHCSIDTLRQQLDLYSAEAVNRSDVELLWGLLFFRTGNYREAKARLDNARSLDPTNVSATLGWLRTVKQLDGAQAALDVFPANTPDIASNVQLIEFRLAILTELSNWPEVLSWSKAFQSALVGVGRSGAEALLYSARAHEQSGNRSEAIRDLRAAIRLDTNLRAAHQELERLQREHPNVEQSLEPR